MTMAKATTNGIVPFGVVACKEEIYDAGVNFKATGDCLIIAPMFICEKKHIDEIIEKLRTGITNYAKSKKN